MPAERWVRWVPGVRCLLALALALASGCVERRLIVRTDPPGAEVWVDGRPRGSSPAEMTFSSYGTREVVARKQGHAPARVRVELDPPWWQYPPFDLFTDLLWPGTIEDVHEPEPLVLERRGELEPAEAVAERARHFGGSGERRP